MRRKFALVSALSTLLTVFLLGVPLVFYAGYAHLAQADHDAVLQAQTLATLTRESARSGTGQLTSWIADQQASVRATVVMPWGARYGAPVPCLQQPEPDRPGDLEHWTCNGDRVASLSVPMAGGGQAQIDVAVDTAGASEETLRVVAALAAAAVLLPAVSVVLADRLVRSVVRTAEELTDVATNLRQGRLDARFRGEGPRELQQLGVTLNALAARTGALVTNERESLADLSHRLRTPITSLMLQAEALKGHTEAERLLAGLHELNGEVTRVIRHARKPIASEGGLTACLDAVVSERVAFWAVLAEEQGRACELTVYDTDCQVYVPQSELEAVVDVLLENVFTHTPEAAGMRITVRAVMGGGAELTIDDDGPGFSDHRVVERGRSTGGSSGLGLDIARRTATISGGRLVLSAAPSGGARATLSFGGPAVSRRPAGRPSAPPR
ncbi:HAMP domain-containing sensor histidine kinase [Streptomyces sp. H27-H1]|uniref:sensor histidine kinase n=1 Tax=Streptomyces sp. H27-H1 TaxID=2996461 RepID=UPI002271F96D|nr:HAMP domain-containing sensor histidine kinase [Streptomyces sp. H27-H1]MCY0931987.1 HAMP domain-containing sensor histidine kinase [Streptomyces sp. H27-H1]